MGNRFNFMINTNMDYLEQISVANVRIDTFNKSTVVEKIQDSLKTSNSFKSIHTLNPEILMQAYRMPHYAKILNKGDINVVDGIGLKIALQLKTKGFFNRICGADLIYDLAYFAENYNRSLLLLGGLPNRLEKAKEKLQVKYPKLKVLSFSPAFNTNFPLLEQPEIEKLIQTYRPGIIAVFLGAPRQEMWISQNREFLLLNDVRIAAGLGGTVDFLSGEIFRAPKWIQSIGLEWAFRLVQEPRRIRRQISNLPEFAYRAVFKKLIFRKMVTETRKS